ncbi:alpha-amylase [Streptomyces tritici]|uniref:alpha-amylase n=1 Tax=Streptomyces tritici TaxID=2054410 RepID=UPI003AF16ACC
MTNLIQRMSRPAALSAAAAGSLVMTLFAGPSAAAGTPAPECVQYFQSWRYTDVFNGCGEAVAVTVEYTNGQWAPCRVIQPGERATFAGYGTDGNYVTGLRTCEPVATSGAS